MVRTNIRKFYIYSHAHFFSNKLTFLFVSVSLYPFQPDYLSCSPNLTGCQAIEDAYVIVEELSTIKSRDEIEGKLNSYRGRRLIRSAAVQGLSRFASDIIIRGFDTPAKIVFKDGIKFENFNYAGIVTKMLQPILPIFFMIQFNFLYDGWKNDSPIDLKATFGFLLVGGLVLLVGLGGLEEGAILGGLGLEGLLGTEGVEALLANLPEIF